MSVPGTFETCADEVRRSAHGARAVLPRVYWKAEFGPISDIDPTAQAAKIRGCTLIRVPARRIRWGPTRSRLDHIAMQHELTHYRGGRRGESPWRRRRIRQPKSLSRCSQPSS